MKNKSWILAFLCLITGIVLYFLNVVEFHYKIGTVNINLYPAAFLLLIGLVLAARILIKNKAAR